MSYDAALAARIRKYLAKRKGISEKQMFGGIAFLVNGNMSCGVHGKSMIVRLAPSETERALAQQHTRVFDLTGRPMKGWILVEPDGVASEADLVRWIDTAVTYAASLPRKQ